MKPITKSKVYADLKYIKEERGIDIKDQLKLVALNESVPIETIIFINKYKPVEQLYTYNKIYENRRKNPLYKNIVNENASTPDKAIALSSLITQTLIHNKELIKENKNVDASDFMNLMDLSDVFEALSLYSKGDDSKLLEVFNGVRSIFKRLY